MDSRISSEMERKQLQEKEYGVFLNLLVNAGIPIYLAGGVAVKVLMGKEALTTFHKDIDILIPREAEGEIKKLLSGAGYSFSGVGNDSKGKIYKLIIKRGILVADIVFFEEDKGNYIVEVSNDKNKYSKIVFDKENFDDSPQLFSGIPIRTLSPLGIIRSMTLYPKPLRSQDITTIKALGDKFFPGENLETEKFGVLKK